MDVPGASAQPSDDHSAADDATVPQSTSQQSTGEAAAQPAAERPSDADIIQQENQIRAAEAQRTPFLGDVEPMSALEAEYQQGSEVFRNKIRSLARQYSGMRRTRGDGNCFFRAFVFAYIEDILTRRDYDERNRVIEVIKGCNSKMEAAGMQPLVFEDAQSLLTDQLATINGSRDGLTADVLLANMRDDVPSNYIVCFLRMATSAEIASRADFFAPFIMGMSDDELSVEQFRRRCVEPMGEESDHVHIVALSDMLQVPIRVLYLDRSMDASGDNNEAAVNHHDFVPDALAAAAGSSPAAAAAASPRVHLLYRPGHYDILYPHSGSDSSGSSGSGTAAHTAAAAAGAAAQSRASAAAQGLDEASVSAALAATIAAFGGGNPAGQRQPAG